MKKLVTALLISLPCYPMQKLIDETPTPEILSKVSITSCNRLPGDLSRKLAQKVLRLHPIVSHILRNITLTSNLTLKGHNDVVNSAAFNMADDRILTASDDYTAKLWNTATGECLLTLAGHELGLTSATFNKAGDKILTASGDYTAKLWNTATGECLLTLAGHEDGINSVTFNKAGDKILTASYDTTAKIWDAATGECLDTLNGHRDIVCSAAFNKAGDKIVTASHDGTAKIWDIRTGACLVTFTYNRIIISAVFNTTEDLIATAALEATIWNTATGEPLLTLADRKSGATSATFNKKGNRIVTASFDNTAKVWNVFTGQRLLTLKGHEKGLTSATFNKAGDKILTASYDTTAKIWNLNDFHQSEQFLFNTVSLTQAIILNAIYEVMVARRLVTLHGENAFTKHDEPKGLLAQAFWLWKIVTGSHVAIKNITLDFNSYPHLQEHYNNIPELLRKVLDPFVTKRTT